VKWKHDRECLTSRCLKGVDIGLFQHTVLEFGSSNRQKPWNPSLMLVHNLIVLKVTNIATVPTCFVPVRRRHLLLKFQKAMRRSKLVEQFTVSSVLYETSHI